MDTSPRRRAAARGKAPSKIGLVSFLERPIDSIRPSPANDKLYRPISPDDPEIIALAKSIQENGVLQALIITQDDFILSGQR
jgi:ParB-like chromosome segregation protein Spo0J